MGNEALKNLAIEEIMESPDALRTIDESNVETQELFDSIRVKGVIEPIQVRPLANGKYAIINGLHRYTGAKKAGMSEIPCKIMDVTDAEALELQIITNLIKVETPPVQYAKHLRQILAGSPTMTLGELAGKIGKSTTWLDARFGLLRLPDSIKSLVDDGTINLSNAFVLSKLPSEEEMSSFIDRATTMSPQEFAPLIKTRKKELAEARAQGKGAQEETFVPYPHQRKGGELKAEYESGKIAESLCRECRPQTPVEGFKLALKWIFNMDAVSITQAQEEFKARKLAVEQAKQRRAIERAEKQKQQAAELQAKAAETIKAAGAAVAQTATVV